MLLNEFMPAAQAAQALTGTDDAQRRQQGVQSRPAAVKQAAAAIDAEQKSTDPLDRRIAQARNLLAQLLQQKQRQNANKPKDPQADAATPAAAPTGTPAAPAQ